MGGQWVQPALSREYQKGHGAQVYLYKIYIEKGLSIENSGLFYGDKCDRDKEPVLGFDLVSYRWHHPSLSKPILKYKTIYTECL